MATYPLPAAFPFGFPVVLDTNTILALWMFQDPALPRLRAAHAEARALGTDTPATC